MMKTLPLIALGWLCGLLAAQAQWRISSQSAPVDLGHGAMQVKKNIAGPANAELNLIFFDAKRCTLRVLDQPDAASAMPMDRAATAAGAVIAGCNGGYFTPAFTPLGLVIAGSKRAGSFQRSSLLGGVLQVQHGRPMLLWRDEYTPRRDITELLQAGPRLVNGGLPVKGLEATRSRPRTFVLTDNNGKWAIGRCGPITLRQLSDLLAASGVITELEIERALNLDGGRSCALWWRTADGREHYEREFTTVRNFLLVVPRKPGR